MHAACLAAQLRQDAEREVNEVVLKWAKLLPLSEKGGRTTES